MNSFIRMIAWTSLTAGATLAAGCASDCACDGNAKTQTPSSVGNGQTKNNGPFAPAAAGPAQAAPTDVVARPADAPGGATPSSVGNGQTKVNGPFSPDTANGNGGTPAPHVENRSPDVVPSTVGNGQTKNNGPFSPDAAGAAPGATTKPSN